MTDRLGNKATAALLALMGLGGKASNTDLEPVVGFRLDGPERRRLNELDLVISHREGNKAFVHKLTRQGWAWCADELSAERPPQAYSLGGALYAILSGLRRFLDRNNTQLKDVFTAPEANLGDGLAAQIRKAYGKLARSPREYVPLADLRPLLDGATKDDVDRVLKDMSRARQAYLAPDSDRKNLTDADHAAAVRIGGEDSHLIAIEGS
jgi:hypothetical protein